MSCTPSIASCCPKSPIWTFDGQWAQECSDIRQTFLDVSVEVVVVLVELLESTLCSDLCLFLARGGSGRMGDSRMYGGIYGNEANEDKGDSMYPSIREPGKL